MAAAAKFVAGDSGSIQGWVLSKTLKEGRPFCLQQVVSFVVILLTHSLRGDSAVASWSFFCSFVGFFFFFFKQTLCIQGLFLCFRYKIFVGIFAQCKICSTCCSEEVCEFLDQPDCVQRMVSQYRRTRSSDS